MTEWIRRAEKALRTGQPRLAELYMRRGLSESPGGRLWLAGHDAAEALAAFVRALGLALEPWQWAILDRWARTGEVQTDFALAGPSKAGA